MAAGALQLYGLPTPGEEAGPRDPRPAEDLGFVRRRLRHALRQAAGHRGATPLHDVAFERFWKRELDIENPDVIRAVLVEAGADATGFSTYAKGQGREEIEGIGRAAEALGVFGVPSFVVDGELFWGREHLIDIRAMLAG